MDPDNLLDDPLLDGLDETQRAAVTSPGTPLAVLAGAGSGKTRVLTRRIAWQATHGHLDPAHTLAVTFTRRAAHELTSRLAGLGVGQDRPRRGAPGDRSPTSRLVGLSQAVPGRVTAGTFHALALAQLGRHAERHGRALPKLLEHRARLVAPLVARRAPGATTAGSAEARRSAGSSDPVRQVVREIEWAKARLVAPDGYEAAVTEAGRATPAPPGELADLYRRYEQAKRAKGLADFDDLVWWAAQAMEADPEHAAAERWRFRHLFVDEFQDVGPAQLRLVRAWLGDQADLTVVGDPDQAIYAFAGAEPGYLGDFPRHFPGARVVRLACNYRSTPQIVAVAERALLAPSRSAPPRAVAPGGAHPRLTVHDDDEAEAEAVAAALRGAHARGHRWSSLAVLFRTNAQSRPLAAALAASGIPVRVRTDDEGPMVERGRGAGRGATWEADPDAVDLATFHAAKGLEWDIVFVTGVEDGFLPIAHATSAAEIAEEHRLAHVALTRARLELHLTRARRRTFGEHRSTRTASPLLARLGLASPDPGDHRPALADAAPAGSAPLGLASREASPVTRLRQRLEERRPATDPTQTAVLTALVDWRSGLARLSGVPTHVIFHDATLRAVASARPRSGDELLALGGVGPVKLARYGDAVLAIVEEHASVSA